MEIKYSDILNEKIVNTLKEFASNRALTGVDMKRLMTHHDLSLTEQGNALGVNTSSMYSKKGSNVLDPNLSILLRLYAAFEDKLPRLTPPDIDDLIAKIRKADPEITPHSIGPILGYDLSSGYRLRKAGLTTANPTTRVLAWLIDQLLDEDLGNWEYIKAAILTEASARGHAEPMDVLKQGGWGKFKPVVLGANNNDKNSGIVKKPLIRRGKTSG
tara:strand:- start:588 stop:1232 length:645 start_codon:yes stop_codon:yes gene_type:complete